MTWKVSRNCRLQEAHILNGQHLLKHKCKPLASGHVCCDMQCNVMYCVCIGLLIHNAFSWEAFSPPSIIPLHLLTWSYIIEITAQPRVDIEVHRPDDFDLSQSVVVGTFLLCQPITMSSTILCPRGEGRWLLCLYLTDVHHVTLKDEWITYRLHFSVIRTVCIFTARFDIEHLSLTEPV